MFNKISAKIQFFKDSVGRWGAGNLVEAGDREAMKDAGIPAVFEFVDEFSWQDLEDLEQFGNAFAGHVQRSGCGEAGVVRVGVHEGLDG